VRRLAAVLVALVAAVSATAAPSATHAPKSSHMLVGIYDDGQTLYNADTAFPEFQQLRAQIIRMQLRWGGPGGVAVRRPTTAGDPSDPAYNWSIYDRAVRRAAEDGIKVIFSIWGTPRWENGGAGYNVAPKNPTDLQQFAVAAANRYSGSYQPANGQVLPAVRYWLAWNEANNPVFLKPQFAKVGKTWQYKAAQDYAKICNAVYSGVHATMLAGEKVGCGVTAPRGNNAPTSARPSTSPLAFLRAAKNAGLKSFDAWAHHPYYGSKLETPTTPPRNVNGGVPTSVTLGNINSLISEVTRLYGNKPIWITEYGYQTNPPDDFFGVSWAKQASYLTQAFGIARNNPRIQMMLWYLLQDEPSLGGWQSGLQTTDGKHKPAFAAFQALPH
jgi:hypothetical protein